MPDATTLAKAKLLELDQNFEKVIKGSTVTVQFNPETLKVSFANQIQTPPGGGNKSGTPAQQFVGAGTTKLALQLWFDVTSLPDGENTTNDVRKLTQRVAYFITPSDKGGGKFVPPAVRFSWGSFEFDGLMESLEESLEFFSNDGRPLRASMSFTLSQQQIKAFKINKTGFENRPPPSAGSTAADPTAPPGTKTFVQAPSGMSVQSLADNNGLGANWQAIASANGIENPRLLSPGQLIDLDISVQV